MAAPQAELLTINEKIQHPASPDRSWFQRFRIGAAVGAAGIIGLATGCEYDPDGPGPLPAVHVGEQADAEQQSAPQESQPAPQPAYDCNEYPNMKNGTAHPVNQDRFNHEDAQGYARIRGACEKGWDGRQYECNVQLWGARESNWNHRAINDAERNNDFNRNRLLDGNETISDTEDDAYGIPQAKPGGKMAAAGPNWRTDPRVQVDWGQDYVEGRYGTPCAALAYRDRNGYY